MERTVQISTLVMRFCKNVINFKIVSIYREGKHEYKDTQKIKVAKKTPITIELLKEKKQSHVSNSMFYHCFQNNK